MQIYPLTIDAALARLLEHFKHSEVCLVACPRSLETATENARAFDSLQKTLKGLRLAFVRVVGVGRLNEAEPSVVIAALLVFNALKGTGSMLPAFADMLRDLARKSGLPLMLHQLHSGPVKVIDVLTGKPLKICRGLEEAAAEYFARVEGNGFRLESLEGVLGRTNGSRWMAGMWAQAVGEMLRWADYTPARFSGEFDLLIEKLRTDKIEMGLVSPRNCATRSMLPVLKEDATALGMAWHELGLSQYGPDTPDHGQVIGDPFLLVTRRGPHSDLRENLNELAVKHRQDHVLFVHRDGAIELVAPYHDTVEDTFVDFRAGIRAYAGTMTGNALLPVVEVRVVCDSAP